MILSRFIGIKFRKRLGEEGFREIFDELVKLAQEASPISKFRIIDATHINALGIVLLVNKELFGLSTPKEVYLAIFESRKRVYLSDLKAMKQEERRDKLKRRSIVERIFAHVAIHSVRGTWYKGLSKTTIHLVPHTAGYLHY